MKNKEKYQNEICNVIATGRLCKFKHRFIIKKDTCQGLSCDECQELTKKWFDEEYKEPIELAKAEYYILKNIDPKFKWIARDKNFTLCIFDEEPSKFTEGWDIDYTFGNFVDISVFKHLFKFIKWQDEEPRNIQKLLENCEVIEDD